jgi:predicted methyltransferase
MQKKTLLTAVLTLSLVPALGAASEASYTDRVAAAAAGEHRSAANRMRNEFRNPVQTLNFFGFEAGDTVLEIWPGGGWYTEILAPAVRGHGELLIANWDQTIEGQPQYRYSLPERLQAKFDERPDLYDAVRVVPWTPPQSPSLGDAGTYDLIVTFRNVHGWIEEGIAEMVFTEFARVLKPGGVLGLVQHRAATGSDPAESAPMGYVPQATVTAMAAAAGLELVASSEINANPRDTRDHPEGVWTLPPGLALEDKDRDRYQAIGESDRMTLKFMKPAD